MIKFRAYDKVKKQVAQVMKLDLQGFENEPRNVYLDNGGNTRHQGDFELMQYTGLKDKNGVEIYELDLLQLFNNIWIVVWENDRFILRYENMTRPLYLDADFSVIIGNIYENPELLETL